MQNAVWKYYGTFVFLGFAPGLVSVIEQFLICTRELRLHSTSKLTLCLQRLFILMCFTRLKK